MYKAETINEAISRSLRYDEIPIFETKDLTATFSCLDKHEDVDYWDASKEDDGSWDIWGISLGEIGTEFRIKVQEIA